MSNPEHIFAIRLFFAATAIAVAGVGVNQADWKHPLFVRALFGSSAVLFLVAIFWPSIAPEVPDGIGAFLTLLSSSLISWLLLLAVTVVAICALDYRERANWRQEFPKLVALFETKKIADTSVSASAEPSVAAKPTVARWFTPLQAVDQFAEKILVAAALTARDKATVAKEERDREYANKSPYQIVADDKNLSTKAQNAEIAFYTARHAVFENLIDQLKQGILIGRALPFNDKKLEGDQDWEIIKASHWSVLTFQTSDQKFETVSGGGQTYRSLQIGRPE